MTYLLTFPRYVLRTYWADTQPRFSFRTAPMSLSTKRLQPLSLFFLLLGAPAMAQEGAKKPLDHDAYDIWNRVTVSALSNDGRWPSTASRPRLRIRLSRFLDCREARI